MIFKRPKSSAHYAFCRFAACRHGIFQLRSGWADGANLITQCPIQPSAKFTYVFNITGQEGTLWWHAHASMLRATIYGALIIKPRSGPRGYPFPKPYAEIPILLGTYYPFLTATGC